MLYVLRHPFHAHTCSITPLADTTVLHASGGVGVRATLEGRGDLVTAAADRDRGDLAGGAVGRGDLCDADSLSDALAAAAPPDDVARLGADVVVEGDGRLRPAPGRGPAATRPESGAAPALALPRPTSDGSVGGGWRTGTAAVTSVAGAGAVATLLSCADEGTMLPPTVAVTYTSDGCRSSSSSSSMNDRSDDASEVGMSSSRSSKSPSVSMCIAMHVLPLGSLCEEKKREKSTFERVSARRH